MLAAAFKRQRARLSLRAAIGDYELPSFPAVVSETLDMLKDPNASAAKIAKLVERDPGLSVGILRAANSAMYMVRREVDNVRQGVAVLGLSNVEAMVISTAVKGALKVNVCRGYDPARFWRAAARRAGVADSLAARFHPATRSESLTAGMLQDVAVPLLARAQGTRYGDILDNWHANGGCLSALEQEAFGYDHAEIAGMIFAKWKLPQTLTDAVRNHHNSENPATCPAAVQLVGSLGEHSTDETWQQLATEVSERFRTSADDAGAIITSGLERAEALDAVFT